MIKLSNFKKVKDDVHIGSMTFREYISFAKEKVIYNPDKSIVQNAELKAIEYNRNAESNEIIPTPSVNLFMIELDNTLAIFDVFTTVMILSLEERFMDNELVIIFHKVFSFEQARRFISNE